MLALLHQLVNRRLPRNLQQKSQQKVAKKVMVKKPPAGRMKKSSGFEGVIW